MIPRQQESPTDNTENILNLVFTNTNVYERISGMRVVRYAHDFKLS